MLIVRKDGNIDLKLKDFLKIKKPNRKYLYGNLILAIHRIHTVKKRK